VKISQKNKFGEYLKRFKLIVPRLLGKRLFTQLRSVYWIHRLKKEKFYEKEIKLLPKFIKRGDICIDIGANMGQYTYPLSKLVGSNGQVFSFEPIAHAFGVLRIIIKKLKLQNVKIFNIALGEKAGRLDFIPTFGGSYLSPGEKAREKSERVEVTTLDKVNKIYPQLNKTKFIKCDVEGSELMIFKGGKKLISKTHPIILCEIEERCTKRYGHSPKDVINFLGKLGYRLFISFSGELREVKSVRDSINNYIFIPRGLELDFKEKFYENSSSK